MRQTCTVLVVALAALMVLRFRAARRWPIAGSRWSSAIRITTIPSLVLSNPKNDAEDVAAALRRSDFEVISQIDANKRDLDLAMAQFARAATDADAALVLLRRPRPAVSGPQLPDADRRRGRGRGQPALPDDDARRRSRRARPRQRRQDHDPGRLPQQSDGRSSAPQDRRVRPAASEQYPRPRPDRQDAGHGGRLCDRGR